jgi:hypothetical protein
MINTMVAPMAMMATMEICRMMFMMFWYVRKTGETNEEITTIPMRMMMSP